MRHDERATATAPILRSSVAIYPLPKEIEHRFRLFNDRDRSALGIKQAHLGIDAQGVEDRGGEPLGRN
jgi:hypothetical protein